MVACRYEIFLLVFNSTSQSFAVLARELSSLTLEEIFQIYARPCIIHHLATSLVEERLFTFKDKNHYCSALSDYEYSRVKTRNTIKNKIKS